MEYFRKLILQHFQLKSEMTDLFVIRHYVKLADPSIKQHGFFFATKISFINLVNTLCYTQNIIKTCMMTLIMQLDEK